MPNPTPILTTLQTRWEALGERWGYWRCTDPECDCGGVVDARKGPLWTLWWSINDWMMGARHWPGQSPFSCSCGASGWRWPGLTRPFDERCRWHRASWFEYLRRLRGAPLR